MADRDRRHDDRPAAGRTETKPGSAQRALPGIGATVVDDEGHEVANGGGGYLVLTEPWPSMLRTIWGDDQRFVDTYWSRFEASTSRATAPRRTTTATSGCSAGSTT